MLMETQHHDVKTRGFSSIQAFGVKNNARLFKALIDDPYSDKMAAAIREPATNAYDAHKRAGIFTRPFEVKLPSMLDPVFRVRDFGPSLDETRFMDLYCTLNSSDKNNSDDEVGGFGVGCKAPFAFVSSFSVTTWLEGQKWLYSAFIGVDGIPQIGCTKPTPSAEPTGLEVSFSVPRDKIGEFRKRAGEILSAFDPLPIILNENFHIAVPEILASGKDWRLEKREGGIRARMGCVFYPIDTDKVYSYHAQPTCAEVQVTIDAPIGALSITNSRESLGYDNKTITYIKARLAEVDKHLWAECQKKIEAQPSYAAACIFLHDQIAGPDVKLWKFKTFQWKGKDVIHDRLETRGAIFVPITFLSGRRTYGKKWKHSPSGLVWVNTYSVPINRLNQLLILLEPPDLDRIPRRKTAAIEANNDRHIVIIRAAECPQQVYEDLAEPEVQSLADYEPPARVSSRNPSKYRGVSMPTRSADWLHVYSPSTLPGEGIYVEADRDEVTILGEKIHLNYVREYIIKPAISVGALPADTKVWLFNGRHRRMNRTNWRSLESVIKDWLKANFDAKHYKMCMQKRDLLDDDYADFFHTLWRDYPEKCPRRIMRFAMEIAAVENISVHRELAALHNRCFPGEFDAIELKPLKLRADLAELLKRYPLFPVVRHNTEHLLHYLSLIN